MIYKREDGLTVVEMGQGTCFIGVPTTLDENKRPVGIVFSNSREFKAEEAVMLHLTNGEAVHSLLFGLSTFLAGNTDGEVKEKFLEAVELHKKHLPKEKVKSE